MPTTTVPATPLLLARRLAYAYPGGTPVFAEVELHVEPREIVCLIGASGCGKSTLLRVLAGLAESGSGSVELASGKDPEQSPQSSVVFQSPALLPWLTVAQNVAFGLDFAARRREPRPAREARLAAALKQVGLADHADKKPRALSGGMAQRVALARALAGDPEIIFLDEPFSALDAITRESMQDLLLALAHGQHSAVLLVTHDIDEALRIADRVLLLAGSPAHIVGEWRPEGRAPRLHRSMALNELREEILASLSTPDRVWYPIL